MRDNTKAVAFLKDLRRLLDKHRVVLCCTAEPGDPFDGIEWMDLEVRGQDWRDSMNLLSGETAGQITPEKLDIWIMELENERYDN